MGATAQRASKARMDQFLRELPAMANVLRGAAEEYRSMSGSRMDFPRRLDMADQILRLNLGFYAGLRPSERVDLKFRLLQAASHAAAPAPVNAQQVAVENVRARDLHPLERV